MKTRKNLFASLLFAACSFLVSAFIILGACASTEVPENLYPQTFMVISVDYYENLVTIKDFNGYTWQFWGAEDWIENDICSAIMDNRGTESIFDDEVVSVRYSGWIENPNDWGY